MIRAAVQGEGRCTKGRVQGLPWGVGAPQAAKQSVVHPADSRASTQEH